VLTKELALKYKPESRMRMRFVGTLKKFIYVDNKNVLVGHFFRILMEIETKTICTCPIFGSHVRVRVTRGDKITGISHTDAQACTRWHAQTKIAHMGGAIFALKQAPLRSSPAVPVAIPLGLPTLNAVGWQHRP